MKFSEYRYLVRSDLHRYAGSTGFSKFLYHYLFEPGFKYSFWMRTCAWSKANFITKLFFPFFWLILIHYKVKFGISIPYRTNIGSGFYIGHLAK